MAFSVGSSDIIGNDKQIRNIGGKGTVISGFATIPGNTTRYIRLEGAHSGVVYGQGGFRIELSGTNYQNSASFMTFIGLPRGTGSSKSFSYNIIRSETLPMELDVYISYSTSSSPWIGFYVINNLSAGKQFYYIFRWTGDGTPTISVV